MGEPSTLTEAAKAASAPLTKLVEVCAAGLGRLYKPTDIRRTARAEGDALVLMEEARIRASEVSNRAVQRLLDLEDQRQENLEAIASLAISQLPDQVSTEPVAKDWTARFFREAQDVSDAEMRQLWAKMLAGEVARPSSFSPRTLRVVADLTKDEAAAFEAMCGLRFVRPGGVALIFYPGDRAYFNDAGFSFSAALALEAAGLINLERMGVAINHKGPDPIYLEGANDVLYLLNRADWSTPLSIGSIVLTPAGQELAKLVPLQANEARDSFLSNEWRSAGWTVSRARVVERRPDGKFDFELINL